MASNRSVHARNVHKKLIYLLCAQMMFPMGAYAIGGTTIVISLSMQLVWMQQFIPASCSGKAEFCLKHVRSRKKNSAIVRVIDRSVVLT
ncbi:unnamed protein product [Caenorhabditis nigoni]